MLQESTEVINRKCILARTPNRAWGHEDDSITYWQSEQQASSAWPQRSANAQKFLITFLQLNIQRCPVYFLQTPSITENEEDIGYLLNSWVENRNSFTAADVVESEEDTLQSLLFLIKISLSISSDFRDKLVNRLNELIHTVQDDDMQQSIRIGSLWNFYGFIRQNNTIKFPDISLTPDGDIFASWFGEDTKEFNVHFLPDRDVLFVLIMPNERNTHRQILLSGEISSDIIMDKLKPYNLSWIKS